MSDGRSAPKYDAAVLGRMRDLWEHARELSAARIAERFNDMTKNAVIGHANRRGWKPRRERTTEPTTLDHRIDALHTALDRVLAETRPFVEGRPKVMVAAEARRSAA